MPESPYFSIYTNLQKNGYFAGSNATVNFSMASLCILGMTWEYMSIVMLIDE